MEHKTEELPVCLALSPSTESANLIAIGYVDGSLQLAKVNLVTKKVKEDWSRAQKSSLRAVSFSPDGKALYSMAKNKALCSYDVETGKRTRCIKKSHKDKPLSIVQLPPSATKGQLFATGDESGQIRTWDWRIPDPIISTYEEQEECINALVMEGNLMLAASSDGTLASYEIRKRKMLLRSEPMHSDLQSIAVCEKFVYVGGGDGHIEVFNRGEYGNLLERVKSGHLSAVDRLLRLRRGLLLTASGEDPNIRLLHTEPKRRLGVAFSHGTTGIDELAASADDEFITSLSSFDQSIRFFPLATVLEKVPLLRASDMGEDIGEEDELKGGKKKAKAPGSKGFFDDLIKESGKGGEDEEEESGEEEGDVESGEEGESGEEEGEGESGEEEGESEEEEESEGEDATGGVGSDEDSADNAAAPPSKKRKSK